MSMTLAEHMALAVLKGDRVAAYALADKLIEEMNTSADDLAKMGSNTIKHPIAGNGFEVWRWPEFKAFCKRAGIMWDLRTRTMTIILEEGLALTIKQEYVGCDKGGNDEESN